MTGDKENRRKRKLDLRWKDQKHKVEYSQISSQNRKEKKRLGRRRRTSDGRRNIICRNKKFRLALDYGKLQGEVRSSHNLRSWYIK